MFYILNKQYSLQLRSVTTHSITLRRAVRFLKHNLFLILLLHPTLSFSQTTDSVIPSYSCDIQERAPHDSQSFTQGLVMNENYFYESSGQYSASFITRYPKNTSSNSHQHEYKVDLPRDIFAEGLTLLNDKLYLISWKKGKAYVLDKDTLSPIETFNYRGEGWGLTHNNHALIMSDGSNILRYYNPTTFKLEKILRVFNNKKPLKDINELEFKNGVIWANQWHNDTIYGINEASGNVIATLDCKALRPLAAKNDKEHVLNGIAYDETKKGFWVTGKYWRYRFLIDFPELFPELKTQD